MSTKGKDAEIFNLGAILLNIPGEEVEVEYVIGSSYHTTNGKEHFILCPFPNVEDRHCKIFVDKDGEFWIQNLDELAKTFINQERLHMEKKKLNFGDIILFGGGGRTAFTYFEFKATEEPKKPLPSSGEDGGITPFPPIASEVGGNHVLVKNILKHFSVEDLKKYRFVSKAWNSAASQLLRKRCAVSIPASSPHEQTKLFRCAKEMEGFASNMRSLSVEIPEFSSDREGEMDAEKFSEDLVKYQLKNSLTYFKNSAATLPPAGIPLFDKILEKVSLHCPNLEHLVLKIDLDRDGLTLPRDSRWSFGPKLKILELVRKSVDFSFKFARSLLNKVDTAKLEKFISSEDFDSNFLSVMHEKNFCNLKEISLATVSSDDLRALANLPSNVRLQKLVLDEIDELEIPRRSQRLSGILEKFRQTLVSLTMNCRGGNVVLPRFEKLEDLSLFYDEDTRITLPPHFLYAKHFPKLKSLMLNSYKIGSEEDAFFAKNTKTEALAQWGLNEGLFNAFVPNGQVCSSLVELNVPYCPPESKEKNNEYSDRLRGMRTLFPNVKGKWIKAGKY